MHRRFTPWLLGLLLVAWAAFSSSPLLGQSPPSPAPRTMREGMRIKLANAQELLAAVVTRDYAVMNRAAEGLSRISEKEIAAWQTQPGPPQYAQQAVAYLSAVQALREAAKARDIERAGTAYANLTSSCITCHRYVRDTNP